MPVDQRRALSIANLHSQRAERRVRYRPKLRYTGEASPVESAPQRGQRGRVDLAGPCPNPGLTGEVVIESCAPVGPDDEFAAAPRISGVVLVADAVPERSGGNARMLLPRAGGRGT